jgi:16S rRNA (guanine527-N7)-methyltransferase
MIDPSGLAGLDVSRETLERLRIHEALVRKWNPAVNLVARSTLDHLWSRHIADSAQIYSMIGQAVGRWVDLGSGGGFPGMVIAILATGEGRNLPVTLVESDQRKAAFLVTAARETGAKVEVLARRIEDLPPLEANFLSARALAPLEKLLTHASRHMRPDGVALFPKGATHAEELRQALESWRFSYETVSSQTDKAAVVLKVRNIARV